MRHHFASRLVSAGVDLYVVQKLLGHSSATMTQRYSHLDPKLTAQAVARLVSHSNIVEFPKEAAQAGSEG